MGNRRNPNSNSVLQALLDATDSGLGELTIDAAITKLSGDPKLRAALQKKWNAHAYPNKSLVWTQLVKDQRLMTLTDPALKALAFMGMYCSQTGLIQVSRKDLTAATGVKSTTLTSALKELQDCGAIRVAVPAVRHAAPIYAVNPGICNKGTRRTGDKEAFEAHIVGAKGPSYLLNRELPLCVQEDTVYDGEMMYNRITMLRPEDVAARQAQAKQRRRSGDDNKPLDGQLSFDLGDLR